MLVSIRTNRSFSPGTWVTSLWLEDNDIGVTGAQHLAHGLSENKYLTVLSLL
ncbi:hypothetical protein T484DRAFT_1867663 [Baffinella frigidus]|nr:hypothetical protein T484DRAFT_1867663 [Cryptophyta sp. CCMP2293]